jgi:hypothetical protein
VFKERYRIQNSEMYITLFPFAYFNHFLYKLEKINDMLDRMESNLILQHFQVDCKLGHSNTIWEYHKMGPRIRTWMHLLHQRKQEQGNEEKYTEDEETRRLNLRQALRWEGRYDLLMVYSPTNSSYANLYDIPWADRRNPAGTPVPDTPQMSPEGRYRLFSLIEKAETTEEKKYGSMQPWASPSTSVMKNVEENADFYRRPLAYQWPHQRKMTIRNEPEHASVFPPLVSRSTTKTTPNSALSRESPSNTEESSSRKDVSANLSASLTTSNDILQYMREKTGKQRRQWKDYMEKQGENDDTDDDTRQRIIQNLRLRLRETQKQHGVLSILKDEDEGNESDVSVHTP